MQHKATTVSLLAALVGLCPGIGHGQTATPELGLEVFIEVCLRTAPSFRAAPSAAAKFGIKQFTDFHGGKLGLGRDETLIVQYVEDKECVVDVPSLPFENAEMRFIDAVTKETGLRRPQQLPFVAGVERTLFVLMQRTTSAHRFSMTKRDA